jgi:hypothetical protein
MTTCQETPHKVSARSNGRIENYDCCRKTGQLCILRQNPNLIVFLLPGSYHLLFIFLGVYTIFDIYIREQMIAIDTARVRAIEWRLRWGPYGLNFIYV